MQKALRKAKKRPFVIVPARKQNTDTQIDTQLAIEVALRTKDANLSRVFIKRALRTQRGHDQLAELVARLNQIADSANHLIERHGKRPAKKWGNTTQKKGTTARPQAGAFIPSKKQKEAETVAVKTGTKRTAASAIALLEAWARESANLTEEQRAHAQAEGDAILKALNQNRAEEGRAPVFP